MNLVQFSKSLHQSWPTGQNTHGRTYGGWNLAFGGTILHNVYEVVGGAHSGPARGLNSENANFLNRVPVLSALCIISQ